MSFHSLQVHGRVPNLALEVHLLHCISLSVRSLPKHALMNLVLSSSVIIEIMAVKVISGLLMLILHNLLFVFLIGLDDGGICGADGIVLFQSPKTQI